MSQVSCKILQLCPYAIIPRCFCRSHVTVTPGKLLRTSNVITSRKNDSDSEDIQKTLRSMFHKVPFSINAKDITGSSVYYKELLHKTISNQKQEKQAEAEIALRDNQQSDKETQVGDTYRIERGVTLREQPEVSVLNEILQKRTDQIAKNQENIVFHDKQSHKQSQVGNVNKVETVISLRDQPEPNKICSKITDEMNTLTCKNLDYEGIKIENKQITNHLGVQLVLLNKEGEEKFAITSKQNEFTSRNQADHIFESQDDSIIYLVIYMPMQKFKELYPSTKVISETEAEYNNSDIENQYTRNLLSYFMNCIDPGSPNKFTITTAKSQCDKNKSKQHIKSETVTCPAAKHAKTHTQNVNNSKESQIMAQVQVISPNKMQSVDVTEQINSAPELPSLPPRTKQKDEHFDMSASYPQQISWGKPVNQTEQEQNSPPLSSSHSFVYESPQQNIEYTLEKPEPSKTFENTDGGNWNIWEHPLVPMPNNHGAVSASEMGMMWNGPNETHKVFTTPTATIPQETQNINYMSAPPQPQHFRWYQQPETNETSSAVQTLTQEYQPSNNMYQNYYQHPDQMYNTNMAPVTTQQRSTSNTEENSIKYFEYSPVWTHGAYPSGLNNHMNSQYPTPTQTIPVTDGKKNPGRNKKPGKNLPNLIQPNTACSSLPCQQNTIQMYPQSVTKYPQSYWSPQFRPEIAQNVKSEPNQKHNPYFYGSRQFKQKSEQPAPDLNSSDDAPLSEIMKMVTTRVRKALKFLNAEEQIKALNTSNIGDDKDPSKNPQKKDQPNVSSPANYYSNISPSTPTTPKCPPGKKCPDPLFLLKKKNDPCISKTRDP